jgi:hypothetical protein
MSRPRKRLTRQRFNRTMETGHPVAALPCPEEPMTAKARPRRALPLILTLVTLIMVGIVGVYASTAGLSDEVSLVAVQAHGGTLDLTIATDAGADSVLTFGAAGSANILPGTSRTSDFTVTNTGSVPATFRFVSDADAAADLAGCFEYSVAPAGGTPVVAAGPMVRNVIAKLGVFQPGVPQHLALTVTALESCATNAAQGDLVAKITAIQLSGAGS